MAAFFPGLEGGRYDSLDVVGIHGVGGATGILATGLLASAGATGLFFGNPKQFAIQALVAVVAVIFAFVGTYILLKIINGLVGLRVTQQEEELGLDLSQHNERGYS